MEGSGELGVFGFLIVLLAGICFCLQNLIVRILFTNVTLFGVFPLGGLVDADLSNSFLLLFMRMAVGVPLMASLSSAMYPPYWTDLGDLVRPDRRRSLILAVLGGGLMFLYLALLYVAIGQIATGIALTLFFTFPVFTALFSWYVFGSRPSVFRWGVMVAILLGSVLTLPWSNESVAVTGWGATFGVLSGVAYAVYTVVAQKSFEQLHPVPFTWISFATTLLLSAVCLGIWHNSLAGLPWRALWIGGLLSALATLGGHVLNNLGIRLIGATTASMLGAANPALTTLLAWVALQEHLGEVQILGVILVTACVALLGQEQRKFARSLNK